MTQVLTLTLLTTGPQTIASTATALHVEKHQAVRALNRLRETGACQWRLVVTAKRRKGVGVYYLAGACDAAIVACAEREGNAWSAEWGYGGGRRSA